jgi:hypothetical protein
VRLLNWLTRPPVHVPPGICQEGASKGASGLVVVDGSKSAFGFSL